MGVACTSRTEQGLREVEGPDCGQSGMPFVFILEGRWGPELRAVDVKEARFTVATAGAVSWEQKLGFGIKGGDDMLWRLSLANNHVQEVVDAASNLTAVSIGSRRFHRRRFQARRSRS
jgi:hypothetical protein